MIHTLEFNQLSTMLLDFVDGDEGFLYLRLAGAETAVNAIWAYLSARESRGKKWGSQVRIPMAGRSPQYVSAAKQMTYRTLRTRLPSGMVDLAMMHPRLTVSEDKPVGFYLVTYEPGLPPNFYDRLNACLTIPLKPDWATWLWIQGQKPVTQSVINSSEPDENGAEVEDNPPAETTVTPIIQLSSLGTVVCYQVKTGERYKAAWLSVIRDQFGWDNSSGSTKE